MSLLVPPMDMSHPEEKPWTILEVISATTDYLKSKGVSHPRLNAELLLAHALRCRRIELYTAFDKPLQKPERERYKELIKRRAVREPLQYILGETEFMGIQFLVDRRVLIPRLETEVLVERTLDLCRQYSENSGGIHILDIGTGCGAVAVSLALLFPDALVTGIDVSAEALEVARMNTEKHNLSKRVDLKRVDIMSETLPDFTRPFHIIVSNPPYISEEDFQHLYPEIRDFEPRSATCDEADGFRFFRRISEVGKRFLRKGGHLLFEVGFGQSEPVHAIMSAAGYLEIKVFKDYEEIERVVTGRY